MRRKFLLSWFLMLLLITGNSSILNANEENVAKVGNTEYATIDEAIAAWTNGTTLTLLADVTLSNVIQLSSTEYHILDLGTYTMTAASGKDAIQYVVKGRSSASYALDIKADAENPGGITATGKAIVVHTMPLLNAPEKDRPITRFYGGKFKASNIVKQGGTFGAGYTGARSPYFYFYGGEFNGNISTNRSTCQFFGGTFNGKLYMSVDSSAYGLVAGGTFKDLSNYQGSALNSDKFTIGSAKGVYDKDVYIDDNGNTVIAAKKPEQGEDGIQADVPKTPGTNDYLYYSKVRTEEKLGYTDVYTALEKNTTATVTVYVEELDLKDSNFKGTIVVPVGNDITITNVPENCTVKFSDGTVLTPDESGNVYTKIEVATLEELKNALAGTSNLPIIIKETIVIPEGAEEVLDLNGKTVKVVESTGNHIYALNNKGNLTIKDTKSNGSITARGIYNGYNGEDTDQTVEGAKMTIESGKFVGMDTNGGAAIFNCAELIIEDGDFTGGVCSVNNRKMGVATIKGGEYHGAASSSYQIQNNGGQLTIKDATVDSGFGAVGCFSGTTTIEKGTYLPTGRPEATCHVVYVAGGATVDIQGGTFKMNYPDDGKPDSGSAVASYYSGTLTISGGSFTSHFNNVSPVELSTGSEISGGTYYTHSGEASDHVYIKNFLAPGVTLLENGEVVKLFEGEGTATSPYLIASEEKLVALREKVNAGETYDGVYFKLESDIALTDAWTAIGNGSRSSKTYNGNSFKGVFDGDNKTISGLTITSTTAGDAAIGLFGVVDGGTVKNLNLTDVNINVPNSDLAGAAIGMMLNGATADKITVSGTIVGHDGVGGIVGRLIIDGTISNCINNASVTSSYGGIGGIVGKAYYEDGANTLTFASVTKCTNNGTITAPMYVGGIVGLARANVTECVNEGEVVGGTQTGGIIGQLIAAGTVSANENTAIISGTNHLGGIIGDYTQSNAYTYYNVLIANNINRGEVSATQCAAIMGCNNIDGFTAMTATGNLSYYWHEGLELFGNPEDMVIDNTNRFVTEFTVSTQAELQAVLDNCRPNTTILLNPAEYGVVYMRPNPANAATKEVDWQGNNYHYETYSCFENLTIKGVNNTRSAEAAVIDAIVIEGGTYYNTAHSQATVYPIMLSLIELKNVVIEDVTFTGEGGYDPQGYGNAINLSGNNIKANGLTVKNCVFNNAENNARLMYKTESTTTEHNYTYNGESFTFVPSLNDITVEGCTFNGGYMGLELRETENLVISGNTFNNVTSRDILLPTNSGCTYTGEVDIINNKSNGAGNRFLRASGIGNATLTVTDNEIVNYQGEDADFIKADGIAEGNTPVIENNTLDGEDVAVVFNNGTVMVVLPVAQIGETKYATLAEAVAAAQDKDVIEIIKEGNYTLPEFAGKELTFKGSSTGTSITDWVNKGSQGMMGSTVHFENLTISGQTENYYGLFHTNAVTYKDCIINGLRFLYSPTTFEGCQFYASGVEHSFWTYGAREVIVYDCDFNYADRAVNCYSESGENHELDITFDECNFNYNGTNTNPSGAVEINSGLVKSIDVVMTDCQGPIQGSGPAWFISQWDPKHGENTVVEVDGIIVWEAPYVAQIGDTKYKNLQAALNAAVAGTGNITVTILEDINLTNVDWNPVTVSDPGYPVVTVEGNKKTITGLNDMLFAGTWAGGSGLIINDLTIANSNIVNDKDDTQGTVGVGAFIGYPQASATITLNNCHLKDSHVEGGHWTGGLIGMAGGYNGNDGPVFMNLTIEGCSVTGSTITGKGSCGGIIGHGSCAAWTAVNIQNTTVSGNTVTSTGSSTNKAGAVMGTIGAAGQPTTANGVTMTGGAMVAATVSGNTVKSGGTAITTIYGRQGTNTGILELNGGTYDNYPIEENVAYAKPAAGLMIEQNEYGTYGLVPDPAYGKVAMIGETYYETLQEAVNVGGEVKVIANITLDQTVIVEADKTVVLDLNGKTISTSAVETSYAINNLGTLTLKDSSEGKTGAVNARGIYNGYDEDGNHVATAKIIVESGEYNAQGTNGGGAAIFNYGIAEINGGTFTSVSSYSLNNREGAQMTIGSINRNVTDNIEVEGGIYNTGAELTINKGDISNSRVGAHTVYALNSEVSIIDGNIHNENSGNATIMAAGTSTVDIDGGKFTIKIVNAGSSYLLDAQNTASYDISGGEFTGGIRAQAGTNYNITGGTYTNEYGNYNVYPGGNIDIKGGTFVGEFAKTFAENNLADGFICEQNADGTYGVVEGLAGEGTEENPYLIKSLTDLKFFRDAVNAGNKYAGKYIKLNADIDLAPTRSGSNWTPIGNSTNKFQGTFDGQNHTISNLVINGGSSSNQGFFGMTTDGEIKNVIFNNAKVSGRLNVGVVAGTPYTSKYTNIKVTGHVEVNGVAYVGGVGGKNAYANWTDITVSVDETSYVNAYSVEDGTAYRTYVGGVIGFNGEGGHTFKNITSNIKVIGSTKDVGGIFGILHYGNNAENVTFTGAVEAPADAKEVGGIAGVWHNEKGQTVTITNAKSEGTVKVGDVTTTGSIVGGAYNADNETADNSGSLIIDGNEAWLKVAQIGDEKYLTLIEAIEAAQNDETITLLVDVEQADGVIIDSKNIVVDLNGKTFTVTQGTNTSNRNFKIIGTSVVTIKNGTMVAAGDYSSGAYGTVRTEGSANVTLDDLKLYNYRGNGLNIKAYGGTTVNISNTEIYSQYGGGIEAAGGTINIAETVKVEQKGMYTAPYNSMAISVNGGGTVIVEGGTYSTECIKAEEANNQGTSHGPWVVGVLNSGGTLIINGGTFSNDNFGDNGLATYARGAVLADTKANVQINGGTFNALAKIIDIQNNLGGANPVVTLKGGTYSADPRISANYGSNLIVVAQGYIVVENDGTYSVVEDQVAKIGDVTYNFLHKAFDAAEDDDEIVVLKDITYTKANGSVNGEYIDGLVYTGDKSFTVNFGGYTITDNGEINDYLVYLKNLGEKDNEITFKNGRIAINAETTAWAAITVGANAATHTTTLNLNNMEVVNGNPSNPSNTSNQVIRTRNGATVNLNDETVVTSYGTSYGVVAQTGSTVNINSGAKVFHTNSGTTGGDLVYTAVSGNGTINIYNGATIESDNYAIHNMTTGNTDINIYGGTITAPVAVHVATNGGNGESAVANISGGTFNGKLETLSDAASIEISGGTFTGSLETNSNIVITGGTFSVDPTDYCAEGYSPIYNGSTYTVIQVSGAQTRDLVAGWSWFSTYVDIELADLQTALGTNGVQIKGQEGFTQYYSGLNAWSPGLSSISPVKMYMIKTNDAQSISLEGDFVAEDRPITLNPGWNWIGYPVRESVPLLDAIENIQPSAGDVIKSHLITAYYQWGQWIIEINPYGDFIMTPGEGYMYYSNSDESYPFTYSKGTGTPSRTASEPIEKHWIADATQYANNMTMIAMLSVDGEIVKGDYEIAAFANGECRGSARPVYIEAIDSYVLIMTINGEEVEELSFKYYDVNNGSEYELSNRVNYSNDAILGTAEEPYMLTLDITGVDEASMSEINIYPNPTTIGSAINLQATCDKVEVFNALGVKIAEYQNVDSIDALETAGIYVIRVTDNNEVKHCRLVVK